METGGGALERLNLLSPNSQPMADSGLGSSNGGGSQGPSETGSQEDGAGTLIGAELDNAEAGTSQPPPVEVPKRPVCCYGKVQLNRFCSWPMMEHDGQSQILS